MMGIWDYWSLLLVERWIYFVELKFFGKKQRSGVVSIVLES